MKLIVDTSKKHVMVSREPVEKNDQQTGRQKVERGTGAIVKTCGSSSF